LEEWELEAAGRWFTHLLPADDLTLILLKGHLLVEEQLFAAVGESVAFPDALAEWRPRYRDLSTIAKALFYREDEDWLWESVERLNTLRNDLVHNLEPKQLENRVERFLEPVETFLARLRTPSEDVLTARLQSVLAFLFGALMRFRNGSAPSSAI
jgi:hypothetical protein